MDRLKLWDRYRRYLTRVPAVGLSMDVSRMDFQPADLRGLQPAADKAVDAMNQLEGGAIANPDEQRMVGHYWLRDADRAPTPELRDVIRKTVDDVAAFAADVHARRLKPPKAQRFTNVLLVGIGGSALGPQLVSDALGTKRDKLEVRFLDNTDPDGIHRELERIGQRLRSTLVVVISKSGGTKETRNGMLEVQSAFKLRGLDFGPQAVAVTGEGSALDRQAQQEGWLRRFAMWDWVGGRTSVTSAVGLLPMALQGLDIRAFLAGAAAMDAATRDEPSPKKNPALMLAMMWHLATNGRGEKDMVILPYKDRLLLMSRYLQQLVMESLGKEHDLDGNVVSQGISVFGNKGSTDQHAYVQQLRDGVDNFFVTFITVLQDSVKRGKQEFLEVEPSVTAGDYLLGFWAGTREALYEKGRGSITITLNRLDAKAVGALIALYERAVGLYATMVNINAYHQPGVEAGKKAAQSVLDLQSKAVAYLEQCGGETQTAADIAAGIGQPDAVEVVFHALEHLRLNRRLVTGSRNRYQRMQAPPTL